MIVVIYVFGIYLLIYFFLKNSAFAMLNEVKTNFRLYPKHYSMPPKWMRKHFNLKKAEIPKYLIFRLYLSMSFLILAPIASIVCFVTVFNPKVAGALIFYPSVFIVFVDFVVFVIMFHIFKRK